MFCLFLSKIVTTIKEILISTKPMRLIGATGPTGVSGITGPNRTFKKNSYRGQINNTNQTKNKMNKWNINISKHNKLKHNYFTKK